MPGLLEVPDGMAEADRRAMGAPRGTRTGPSLEPARRAPPSRRSEVLRRHSVDSLDRSSLERAPAPIRESDNLLAAPSHLGRGRDAPGDVARVPRGFE